VKRGAGQAEGARFNVRGHPPFARMRWATPAPRPASFALQLADGTRALVVGGAVVRVEVAGERPEGWQARAAA
jgi:hypothetical protein